MNRKNTYYEKEYARLVNMISLVRKMIPAAEETKKSEFISLGSWILGTPSLVVKARRPGDFLDFIMH